MSKGLSDSFEEFLDYETEVFDELENRYSEEIRDEAESRYQSQIPRGPLENQVRWLESRFYSFLDDFYVEEFISEPLSEVYSSVLLQDKQGQVMPSGEIDTVNSLGDYGAVVLDHSVVFDVLEKSQRTYWDDGRRYQEWDETLEVIDEAAEASSLYVPSDLTDKTDRIDFLGEKEGARIFTDNFGTLDMQASVEVPDGHERMREDLLIGSESEDLAENVLILTFDSDFSGAVSHHFDIEASAPIRD